MSFTPIVIGSGYVGWKMLSGTSERQMEVMSRSPELQRDETYFRQNIGGISSAAELVSDRRLLKVALGAFGLDADLGNKAFVRRILEDGTIAEGALANKLSDKRYAEFSRAFGFDLGTPRTRMSDFADKILGSYKDRQFELAVGRVDDDMRLALNAKRELGQIAGSSESDTAKWFRILGSPPLREVLETAFGLPDKFSSIDLDRQLEIVRDKADRLLGGDEAARFGEEDVIEKVVTLFTARRSVQGAAFSSGASVALTLLGGL